MVQIGEEHHREASRMPKAEEPAVFSNRQHLCSQAATLASEDERSTSIGGLDPSRMLTRMVAYAPTSPTDCRTFQNGLHVRW